MKTPKGYKKRYEGAAGRGQAGSQTQPQPQQRREETVQDLIAYLYSVVRDDEAMVRMMDRALKERYDYYGNRN